MSNEKLATVEATLAALERHRQAAATANFKACRAETLMHMHGDDPEQSAKYKADVERHRAEHADALAAHAKSGITDQDIALASQAVLDARGEAHTELNILPPGHGMRTVNAEIALSLTKHQDDLPFALQRVAIAAAADREELLTHVAAGHACTQGAAS